MGECKLGLPQNHCDINMLSAALILNKFLASYECRCKVWPPSYVCRLMFTHPTLGIPAINIHMPNSVVMNKPQQTYLNIINQVLIHIVVVPSCINIISNPGFLCPDIPRSVPWRYRFPGCGRILDQLLLLLAASDRPSAVLPIFDARPMAAGNQRNGE